MINLSIFKLKSNQYFLIFITVLLIASCSKKEKNLSTKLDLKVSNSNAISTQPSLTRNDLLNDNSFLTYASHIKQSHEGFIGYINTLDSNEVKVFIRKIRSKDSTYMKQYAGSKGFNNLTEYFISVHADVSLLQNLIKLYGDSLIKTNLNNLFSPQFETNSSIDDCENGCYSSYGNCLAGAYQNYLFNLQAGIGSSFCCYDVGQDISCCVDSWYYESWAADCYNLDSWLCQNNYEICRSDCHTYCCGFGLPADKKK